MRARALGFLSRREYSRAELRRKLLTPPRRASAGRRPSGVSLPEAATQADAVAQALAQDGPFADPAVVLAELGADDPRPTESEVDAVLDWLAARGYLSDERFVESRLHARAPRHGSLRIRQELARHGVEMSPEQAAQLRDTDAARAHELWQRRFGAVATDPKERARHARFLAARGFPADIVRRIVGGDDDL